MPAPRTAGVRRIRRSTTRRRPRRHGADCLCYTVRRWPEVVFVGHFAVAFAGKRFAPHVSLALLIFAAALSDVLWILFFPLGIERVEIQPGLMPANSLNLIYFPYSHSLLMAAVWGSLLAGVYFFMRKDQSGALILFIAVMSHWILDFVTHRPDMQLMPGMDVRLGLGLWNSRLATFIVEGVLWFGALRSEERRGGKACTCR